MRVPKTSFVAALASLLLLVACGTPGPEARGPAPHASAAVATFSVSGNDGGAGIDITYGSQNANLQGGSKLPWSTTMPIEGSAQFYAVQAQLNGAGSITCSVRVKGVTKTSHVSGGYDVCRAEVVNELNGRWAPSSAS
ncbi:MAG: hypothetical protein J2P43_14400 [Candidatus Dormibacteraeota bacterium]|nr:hypothetical protein [Candidatus Dormibacteraeota bacterium]